MWRTQYALTHTLVPESPRAILVDFVNIEKLFAEKANEAARASKAKVAATAKLAGEQVPRKGKRTHGEGLKRGPPRRTVPTSFANGARLLANRSRPTTPRSVVGSTRTAARRTGWLSPLTPQRSPGRNQEVESPLRWLI